MLVLEVERVEELEELDWTDPEDTLVVRMVEDGGELLVANVADDESEVPLAVVVTEGDEMGLLSDEESGSDELEVVE